MAVADHSSFANCQEIVIRHSHNGKRMTSISSFGRCNASTTHGSSENEMTVQCRAYAELDVNFHSKTIEGYSQVNHMMLHHL